MGNKHESSFFRHFAPAIQRIDIALEGGKMHKIEFKKVFDQRNLLKRVSRYYL
ncbi:MULTISPECIES: hypothetical protein [Bacillus cereus group]|uniref:hypothetical protein n=1 Tax=Bacillus cereus group TaxID=86661 RepID=UPI001C03994C|nr:MULTISPECIES: hypothetical protein [Bacillus cereus group]WJE23074.1 hypothetical protein QRE65_00145 [Bacillus cereus]